MSQTRKKLRRLFQAPSTTEGQSFGARDLERSAREFDLDGQVVERSADAPKDGPAQPKQAPKAARLARPRDAAQPPRVQAPHAVKNAVTSKGDRHPITFDGALEKSRNYKDVHTPEAVRKANTAAKQTAPWAAANAFQSWNENRAGSDEKRSGEAPAAASPKQQERAGPSVGRERPIAAPESARARTVMDPLRHSVVQGRQDGKTTGPQAGRDFAQWKEQRATRPPQGGSEAAAEAVTTPQESVIQPAPQGEPATTDDSSPSGRVVSHPNDASDRVQRRALKSGQALTPGDPFPPKRKRKTLHVDKEAEAQTTDAAAPLQPSLPLPPATRAHSAAPPVGQTPSERLMWLIAHPHPRSSEETVKLLRELEDAPLRAAHQARRLRLLASALLELERHDEALTTLHALHGLLPHDSWVSLTLAEIYARDVGTWDEALQWCDQTLRLHPWLSKAQTLRDHLEERLARLN